MMVHIIRLPHARSIWLTLEQFYVIQNKSHYSTLIRDFNTLNKGSFSIEDYLQEAMKISDNLTIINRSMSPTNLCHQILLNLCPEYKHLISILLIMGIVASFEKLYGILLQYDTQLRLQNFRTHLALDGVPSTTNYV